MVASSGQPGIPVENLPPLGIKNAKLKFAPKDAPELGITRGMAIGGLLYLKSGAAIHDLADALLDVSTEGIIGKGSVAAFELGPVKLDKAAVDLALTREAQHCVIAGQADFAFMNSHVDLNISKTTAHFETETQIFNAFQAEVNATAALDVTEPQFLVQGKMQNDFKGRVSKELSGAIIDAIAAKKSAATITADAATRAWKAAVAAREKAHDNWANTPLLPRDNKVAKRKAWTAAIATATQREAERVFAEGAERRWTLLHDLAAKAGAASNSGGLVVVNRADFTADLANLKGGAVKQMHLNLTFREQTVDLNLTGWNFRDIPKSLKEAARNLADQLIATVQ
jgi:hypothetical protein